MSEIYVFGHKSPDTDSITSAIALAYLKKQLGFNVLPKTLGDINRETKFVLDYFKIEEPKYLNDVKLQIRDLDYFKNYYIHEKESLYKAYQKMMDNVMSTIPVVDEHQKLQGIISMKDITKNFIGENFDYLNTSYQNIIDTIDGKEVLKFDDEIKGNILLASYKSTTFIESIDVNRDTVLIVGDRHAVIEYAILNKARLIIVTGNRPIKDKHLELAKKNKVNIIYTPHFSFKAARYISFCNYVSNLTLTENIITFNQNEDVDDFVDIANKSKYNIYPVVDKHNKCLGIVRLSDLASKHPKKVILVDHNASEQSVDGIEQAQIMEIIDHHNLGVLATSLPINFRNMPVGSTNTIIYSLFKENNVEIPSDIAGVMLSGILSDTLILSSPTTTEQDRNVVAKLASIANIEYQKYGLEMFKYGTSLEGKTKEEVLYTDFKNYTFDGKKIGIGQIFTLNIEEILNDLDSYVKLINSVKENNGYYIVTLFVTDIINNGSYIIFNDSAIDILDNSFKIPNIKQGQYLDNIVSRKKQIVPNIMETIEKK